MSSWVSKAASAFEHGPGVFGTGFAGGRARDGAPVELFRGEPDRGRGGGLLDPVDALGTGDGGDVSTLRR
ncbi:MAG TPA: hypothetical protein DD420_10230, partial [Streptomyces sp.]|nr:hypothetical protein [Streptomyces sp.]